MARCVLQKICDGREEDQELSTVIVDSILKRSNVPLEEAIAAESCNIDTLDYFGYSPLHWASYLQQVDTARLLLQAGAAVNLPTRSQNETPLHFAAAHQQSDMISLLVGCGANVEARLWDGRTPLHLVDDVEVIRMLLAAGANPNATCKEGENALHNLIRPLNGREPTALTLAVSELVAAGADYNHQNNIGWTPLHVAAFSERGAAIRVLHSFGARLDVYDKNGNTFLDNLCRLYGSHEIDSLRAMWISGIDPDRKVDGESTVDKFETRMFKPWWVFQERPTQADVFSFYAMVHELRQRNWEAGLFLESKEMLESEGRVDRLRRWLGCQWQRIHDDEGFADRTWDLEDPDDIYPDQLDDRCNSIDYDTSLIFGVDYPCVGFEPRQDDEQDEEHEDEFFDALP